MQTPIKTRFRTAWIYPRVVTRWYPTGQSMLEDSLACAIDDTGVVCWGSSDDGQSTVPVLINTEVVSAGYKHTCALNNSGVVCWGRRDDEHRFPS